LKRDPVLHDTQFDPIIQILVNHNIIKIDDQHRYVFQEWAQDTAYANYLYKIIMGKTSFFQMNSMMSLLHQCREFLKGRLKLSSQMLVTSGLSQLHSIHDEMERRSTMMSGSGELGDHDQQDHIDIVMSAVTRTDTSTEVSILDRVIDVLFVRRLRPDEITFTMAVNAIDNGLDHRERKMALEVVKRLLYKNKVNMHRVWDHIERDAIRSRGRSNICIPKGVSLYGAQTCEGIVRELTHRCALRLEREKVQREVISNKPSDFVPKRIQVDECDEDDVDTFGCPSPRIQRTSNNLKYSMNHVRTASYSIWSPSAEELSSQLGPTRTNSVRASQMTIGDTFLDIDLL